MRGSEEQMADAEAGRLEAEDVTTVESTMPTTTATPVPSAPGTVMAEGPALNPTTERELPPPPPMINVIENNCARSYIWTMAALEKEVQQKADEVCLQGPLRESARSGISHSAYDFRNRKRVWMAVRTGSGHTTNDPIYLARNAGD